MKSLLLKPGANPGTISRLPRSISSHLTRFWLCWLLVGLGSTLQADDVTSPATQPIKILLLGDSTTEGSIPRIVNPEGPHLEQVIEQLVAADGTSPQIEVINLGLSGEYIRRLIDSSRYEKLVPPLQDISYIFIRYGLNDRNRLENFPKDFPKDYEELLGLLKKDHPKAVIYPTTVIPYYSEADDEEINQLVRAVAEKAGLELFDLYPRYAKELKQGQHSLNYRRFPMAKVPAELLPMAKPYENGGSVVVLDNLLDAHFGHLPGWYQDRHPNQAGYRVIADETARFLKEKLPRVTQPKPAE